MFDVAKLITKTHKLLKINLYLIFYKIIIIVIKRN